MPTTPIGIWVIATLTTLFILVRPFRWNEALWAVSGAALLVVIGLVSAHTALTGIIKGSDVYLFLIGMMLLAEIARAKGLFDWLAAVATRNARGSAARLFTMIYLVGIAVTVFLSNDATAVVLTPAVASAVAAARVKSPLPYLLICAFIANAASFVLPISNPANLVLYGDNVPSLVQWLPQYALPSLLAIGATYVFLRWTQRAALKQEVVADVTIPVLSTSAKTTALGIGFTAVVLLASSAAGIALGLPTALAGIATVSVVCLRERCAPWRVLKGVAWSVLPLVAGLFVLVEALNTTGAIESLTKQLQTTIAHSSQWAAVKAGLAIAVGSNVINNLPAGLIAANVLQSAAPPDSVTRAVLVGVDLGPNLSVTGSLATILWLGALRREGHHISAWKFLKLGFMVMPLALLLALGSISMTSQPIQ